MSSTFSMGGELAAETTVILWPFDASSLMSGRYTFLTLRLEMGKKTKIFLLLQGSMQLVNVVVKIKKRSTLFIVKKVCIS